MFTCTAVDVGGFNRRVCIDDLDARGPQVFLPKKNAPAPSVNGSEIRDDFEGGG